MQDSSLGYRALVNLALLERLCVCMCMRVCVLAPHFKMLGMAYGSAAVMLTVPINQRDIKQYGQQLNQLIESKLKLSHQPEWFVIVNGMSLPSHWLKFETCALSNYLTNYSASSNRPS